MRLSGGVNERGGGQPCSLLLCLDIGSSALWGVHLKDVIGLQFRA